MREGKLGERSRRIGCVIAAALVSAICAHAQEILPSRECTDQAAAKSVIVPRDEPGEPMVVAGHVFGSDGHTAIKGALVFFYHTDARGYYAPDGKFFPPRLTGCAPAIRLAG